MSLEVIEKIRLDCDDLNQVSQITVKKGNNLSNVILASIFINGVQMELENINIRYVLLRPDGTQKLEDAKIYENQAKIILKDNDLAYAGICKCEIILSENSKILATSNLYIKILPNVLQGNKIINTDEYGTLFDIINKADETLKSMSDLEDTVAKNENLRVEAEEERINKFEDIKIESQQIFEEHQQQTQYSKTQADYAKEQGDYAKEQGDYAKEQGNNLEEQIDYARMQGDYAKEQGNYAKEQAEKIADTDVGQMVDEISDIKNFIGYTDSDIYGVEVDLQNNKITRLAGAKFLKPGADFDNIKAFSRKRCILEDSGREIACFGEPNYTESGRLADGRPVQVMVRQPKFYYKVVPINMVSIDNGKFFYVTKIRYYISDTPKKDFKLHPAFIKNNVQKDKIYLSAFEGCIYDTSADEYLLENEQIADFESDKLSSIANSKPCSGSRDQHLNRENARKLANNRGAGFSLSTIQTISLTQLLFLIEYACFDAQTILGNGVCSTSDSVKTGSTSSFGNISGSITNDDNINTISYRGEENIYGNLWQIIDGITLKGSRFGEIYVADHNFEENKTDEHYKNTLLRFSNKHGYIYSFRYSADFDWLFIAGETTGNSELPVGDMLYQNYAVSGYLSTLSGGAWNFGKENGIYCFALYYGSTYYSGNIGARLVYIP